jgi:hypothetical protein
MTSSRGIHAIAVSLHILALLHRNTVVWDIRSLSATSVSTMWTRCFAKLASSSPLATSDHDQVCDVVLH